MGCPKMHIYILVHFVVLFVFKELDLDLIASELVDWWILLQEISAN